MKSQRAMSLLTLANFGIAIFLLLHHIPSVEATSQATILRGSGLEIVDAHGTVRASISIQPEGPARFPDGSVEKDGRIYPETVLLRLIRPDGRPSSCRARRRNRNIRNSADARHVIGARSVIRDARRVTPRARRPR